MTQHVVQFSAGIGSFATAVRVADQHGTRDLVLLIADTGIEDPDLWRFADDTARLLRTPLTVVRTGLTPWDVFAARRYLGNDRLAPCSAVLKQQPCCAWLTAHADPADTVLYVGIEPTGRDSDRIPAITRGWAPWRVEYPLCAPDAPPLTKAQLLDEARALGVRPPRLYKLGFAHNNCGGMCVRAGQRQWEHLLRVFPERFAEAEAHENALRAQLGNVAILRNRRTGARGRPLPLAELRERVQSA